MFVGQGQHRLRAGWRILALVLVFAGISRAFTPIVFAVFGHPEHETLAWWILRGVIVVVSVTLAVWVARRWIDRRAFTALGLRGGGRAVLDLLAGFLISALMLAAAVGTFAAFGHVEIDVAGWSGGPALIGLRLTLWFIAIGAAVAWSEELALRGYILQNLTEGVGLARAVVLSCALYGLLHMANPNATVLSGLLIAAVGYLRIFGWLRTGQLWLSMGMHAGWNFFQGPLLGFSVSGMRTESVLRTAVTGPSWLSGGEFGPEAGVLTVPALVLGGACMVLWTRGRSGPTTGAATAEAVTPALPTTR